MENDARLKNEQKKRKKACFCNTDMYELNYIEDQQHTSYLKKITATDKELLRRTVLLVRPNSINYEDSWGYIIQATRHGGFKWHDPQTGSLIFFGKKSVINPTLVIPSFFAEPKYLSYVINLVQKTTGALQTVLKNINIEDVKNYLAYGFRPYKKNEGWCKEARFDDQTYPQLVIDLEKLAKKRGKTYKKLRTALNKKPNIVIREYHENDKNDVFDIFALKDRESQKPFKKANGMYLSSHAMYPASNIDKFVIIDNITGKIIGFTATSDITSQNTTLVASLFKPGFKIASVWGIYKTLMIKYYQGFQKINLGGCETIGSYNFMRRTFQPVNKLKKTHLVYNL